MVVCGVWQMLHKPNQVQDKTAVVALKQQLSGCYSPDQVLSHKPV